MTTPDWVKRAKVGDKVVCVCNSGTRHPNTTDADIPNVGDVYTIREIKKSRIIQHKGCYVYFRVNEETFTSALYYSRPEPRKTDISQFKKLLKPSKVNA